METWQLYLVLTLVATGLCSGQEIPKVPKASDVTGEDGSEAGASSAEASAEAVDANNSTQSSENGTSAEDSAGSSQAGGTSAEDSAGSSQAGGLGGLGGLGSLGGGIGGGNLVITELFSIPKPSTPKPCSYDEWGPWLRCSNDCGYGLQKRFRTYSGPEEEEADCDDRASGQSCNTWEACAARRRLQALKREEAAAKAREEQRKKEAEALEKLLDERQKLLIEEAKKALEKEKAAEAQTAGGIAGHAMILEVGRPNLIFGSQRQETYYPPAYGGGWSGGEGVWGGALFGPRSLGGWAWARRGARHSGRRRSAYPSYYGGGSGAGAFGRGGGFWRQ